MLSLKDLIRNDNIFYIKKKEIKIGKVENNSLGFLTIITEEKKVTIEATDHVATEYEGITFYADFFFMTNIIRNKIHHLEKKLKSLNFKKYKINKNSKYASIRNIQAIDELFFFVNNEVNFVNVTKVEGNVITTSNNLLLEIKENDYYSVKYNGIEYFADPELLEIIINYEYIENKILENKANRIDEKLGLSDRLLEECFNI